MPGVVAYIFFSPEGIPIKFANLEYRVVVQYAALISDLVFRTKSNVRKLPNPLDNDVVSIRIRTAKSTELIITTVNDFTMLAVQQCQSQVPKTAALREEVKEMP